MLATINGHCGKAETHYDAVLALETSIESPPLLGMDLLARAGA